MSIDKNEGRLNVYEWHYIDVSLAELEAWCKTQIENGKTHATLEFEYGHYNDLDNITLVTKTNT